MSSGIYCIENKINKKKYIGLSTNLEKRMYDPHYGCKSVEKAFKKYGKNNFISYVLIYCEAHELKRLEIECIKIFKSRTNQKGYNILEGGNFTDNKIKRSDKTKEKIRKSKLGKNNPNYKKSPSLETREKQRLSSCENKSYRFNIKEENSTSLYKGVYKVNYNYKNYIYTYWRFAVQNKGKKINSKTYKTEIEAAIAYDLYIIENKLPNNINFNMENYT